MRFWRFIVGVFALIGLLAVLLMAGVAAVTYNYLRFGGLEPAAPDSIVLRLDLRQGPPDRPPADPLFRRFDGGPVTLRELVDAVDRAAGDPRVAGMVGIFGGDAFGLATAQELRDAVRRFRDGGKFALAYADSLGEAGPGNTSYYLASSFDEVWLMPLGSVGLTGIRAEVPFAREALDEFGLTPEFDRRGAYKSFPEMLTEERFTPTNREMTESLVGDLFNQLVAGIAEARGRSPAEVRALIDGAPYTAEEALAAGLVDRLAQRPDLRAEIESRAGEAAETLDAADYLAVAPAAAAEDPARFALIYATGTITLGRGDDDPLFGGRLMSADTVSDAIEQAIDDPDIAAIVVRIDSGGGSAVASEVIGETVRRATAEDKPLIVSMGGAAASGGYWIAAGAREIVAQPATLTGSIGVFAGKVVTDGMWQDLGVNWQGVQRGRNADLWSATTPYSADGGARLGAMLDAIYGGFLDRVADGRGLDRADVEAVAQGRVWTGDQALSLGLVDRLGGLDVALRAAREAAGLSEDAAVELTVLPLLPTPLERLLELASGGGLHGGARADAALARLDPYLRHLEPLLTPPGEQLLRMPEITLQ